MVEPTNGRDIDWEAIASQLPSRESTKLQTGQIPERSYWILRAAAGAKRQSISQLSSSLINAQVRRFEATWFDDIAFLAAQDGVSFEAKFIELASGD